MVGLIVVEMRSFRGYVYEGYVYGGYVYASKMEGIRGGLRA